MKVEQRIFASFAPKEKETGLKLLVGKYRDFDTKWYYDVGTKICVAMISNSIIGPFLSKAF